MRKLENIDITSWVLVEVTVSSYVGIKVYVRKRSQNSIVGIAADYGLDDRGVKIRVPVWSRIFLTSSRPALGPTQPPIQ
jgi:hypothetical protein